MRRLTYLVLLVLIVACGAVRPAAAQSVTELLRLAPDETNGIAIIRVQELHESALGQKEGWAEQHSLRFMQGAANVPPWARLLVRASHLQPGVEGGDWNIAVATFPARISLNDVRVAEGASVGSILDHPAVAAPSLHGYIVEVEPATDSRNGVMALLQPATRQDAGRWLEHVTTHDKPELSDYLLAAGAEEEPQVIVAVDMRHMLDPDMVRARLLFTDGLIGKTESVEKLVSLINGLQGVRFEARVTETMQGRIVFDFSETVGPEGKHLKKVFSDVLRDSHAALDELDQSVDSIEGSSVRFDMPLTDSTLRRVLSLIGDFPVESASAVSDRTITSDREATLRYFRSIEHYLSDLYKTYTGQRGNYLRTAQWHKTYAQRIRRLRSDGVDPNVVAYGANMSDSLEALSESLRGVRVEMNQLEKRVRYWGVPDSTIVTATVWPGVTQPVTWADTVRVESNLKQVRSAQSQAAKDTAPDREEIWAFIGEQRQQTSEYLVKEYGYRP